jgi:hypothetical protein
MRNLIDSIYKSNHTLSIFRDQKYRDIWHTASFPIRIKLISDVEPFDQVKINIQIQRNINEKHSSFSN